MLRQRRGDGRGAEAVAKFKVHADVVAQRVEDQIVVVNLTTNRIFALSSTAARVWELLSEGRDQSEIQAQLSQEYAIDGPELRKEIERLLAELNAESLVESSNDC
jgi:hypothetical protein